MWNECHWIYQQANTCFYSNVSHLKLFRRRDKQNPFSSHWLLEASLTVLYSSAAEVWGWLGISSLLINTNGHVKLSLKPTCFVFQDSQWHPAGQWWWCSPSIPATWEAEAGECLSSRTAQATQRNPASKRTKKQKPQNNKNKTVRTATTKNPKPTKRKSWHALVAFTLYEGKQVNSSKIFLVSQVWELRGPTGDSTICFLPWDFTHKRLSNNYVY